MNFHNIDFSNTVIRLDNRETIWDEKKEIAQRWMYLRSIGFNWQELVKFNFYDVVISTGFNRGLEWYYVNPLSSLFMERKHQYHWQEGGDSTTITGLADNDNHFIGGDWKIKVKIHQFYGEWLIDEWQLSSDYRDNMQTVFGLLFGYEYNKGNLTTSIEYAFGSPWLYLSRGLFNSPEYHDLPLGLRQPNMQSIGMTIAYIVNDYSNFSGAILFSQSGDQTINTRWDAWNNKIPVLSFEQTLPVEIKVIYNSKRVKYFQNIGVYHNWMGSNSTHIVIGWEFNKNI